MRFVCRPPRQVGVTILLLAMVVWHAEAVAGQLSVSWVDPYNDQLGFSVERGIGTAGPFGEIGTTAAGVTAYTDPSVSTGTTYCYRVRAFNAAGYSDYSNVACGASVQMFGLAVVKMGAGSGTVTSSPIGIICGTSCSGTYPSGTLVTLTAVPAAGSTFTGWSGGGCSGTGSCTVTLTATTTVTASFAQQPSDTTPPAVSITSPAPGATVAGVVTVAVSASDDVGVTALSYYVDGGLLAVVSPPSLTFSWNSTTAQDGPHTLAVTASDAAGNTAQASVSVTVSNTVPTTAMIDAPAVTYNANATVTVTVNAAAGTPEGTVSLVVDNGAPLNATLSSGRAQFTLMSPAVGDHTLSATYAAQGSFGASSVTGTLHVNAPALLAPLYFNSATFSAYPIRTKVAITVLRSEPTGTFVTVDYATSDGTAQAGVNYVATSGTLRFKPGVTKQTFSVQILRSTITTPKTVNLTLSHPSSGGALGVPSSAVLTLANAASAGAGLVATYSFNEGSGTKISVADSSRNNNTGTFNGPTWAMQNRFSSALAFNGSGYVTVPDASLDLITGMTLEASAFPTATPANWRTVIMKEQPGQFAYALYAGSPGANPYLFFNASTSSSVERGVADAFPLPPSAWSHLAGTYDGTTGRLYVNGTLATSQALARPSPHRPAPFASAATRSGASTSSVSSTESASTTARVPAPTSGRT